MIFRVLYNVLLRHGLVIWENRISEKFGFPIKKFFHSTQMYIFLDASEFARFLFWYDPSPPHTIQPRNALQLRIAWLAPVSMEQLELLCGIHIKKLLELGETRSSSMCVFCETEDSGDEKYIGKRIVGIRVFRSGYKIWVKPFITMFQFLTVAFHH